MEIIKRRLEKKQNSNVDVNVIEMKKKQFFKDCKFLVKNNTIQKQK